MPDAPTTVEIDCLTGEVTERPLTPEELAQRAMDDAAWAVHVAAEQAEQAARDTARASALAKLAALGLTADEIAAMLT